MLNSVNNKLFYKFSYNEQTIYLEVQLQYIWSLGITISQRKRIANNIRKEMCILNWLLLSLFLIYHEICGKRVGRAKKDNEGLSKSLLSLAQLEKEAELDTMLTGAVQEGWEFSLPGYKYCGPGTPLLDYVTKWKENPPINKLDLACFYHDLTYINVYATAKHVLWADQKLIEAANSVLKEYDKQKIPWYKKLILKIEAKLVVNAFRIKAFLEDKGIIDPLKFVNKNYGECYEVFSIVEKKSLPEAWNLSFAYPSQHLDTQLAFMTIIVLIRII
eukprot:TRINITY_DN121519_c0_g1_i1.p1 TRINITY_DN121519_c0_g1~~TRINITY_DN121519_c0_g1_i1.p1  ORF type:complete len:294 (+),score=15.52 TRINITY_DN121519_c0_g1_i1:62-883(+)